MKLEPKVIQAGKRARVSALEKGLPGVTLDEWLRALVPESATITWEANDCGEQTGSAADDNRDLPVCAEALVKTADGIEASVSVAAGTVRKGVSGHAVLFDVASKSPGGAWRGAKKLSDLKGAFVKR
ncbi:MAG: hypothetical protein E6G33_05515 [Actinobacteria bacterium]|nr:MAG: hypothetical protein E6G33_05515 [Actinomycetota bacterium]